MQGVASSNLAVPTSFFPLDSIRTHHDLPGILVTISNDDGYDAPGLKALEQELTSIWAGWWSWPLTASRAARRTR